LRQLTYLKRFALSSLLCLCVTAMCCGGALVDTNSRELTFGQKELRAGVQQDKRTVTFFVAEQTYALPAWDTALRWARLTPAPAGSLAAIAEALAQAVAGFKPLPPDS